MTNQLLHLQKSWQNGRELNIIIPFYTNPYGQKENISPPPEAEFSEKELNLFAKRYDEGYDLFDQRYELWLQKHHPEDTVICKALFEEGLKVEQ